MEKDMITLQQRKKVKEIFTKARGKAYIAAAAIISAVLISSAPACAMQDAVYSYTVENGEVNLMSATIPNDMEILDIPSVINGMTVTSIDNCFTIYQEDEEICEDNGKCYHRDTMVLNYGSAGMRFYRLRKINIPNSVSMISGVLMQEFEGEGKNGVISISKPEDFVLTESKWPGIYYSNESVLFRLRQPKIEAQKVLLPEVGNAVNVYLDCEKTIDGCLCYNGITYVPQHEIANKIDCLIEDYFRNSDRFYRDVMLYRVYEKADRKYIDGKSAYTSAGDAVYKSEYKRILFNSNTGEMMVRYYFKSVDEGEIDPLIGIKGGEIEVKVMPIFPGYVPLRALCEAVGCGVEWDGAANTVYVTSPV